MDNKKIGTLIAELRKKKGLTQQDLGDMVGVGFRAVSKWERGITLPDISIINELSKILGITSDELLSGKINKENKEHKDKKIPSKFKITFSIIITITILLITTFIYSYNQIYTYDISSQSNEYYIEGQVIFNKKDITLIINKLEFINKELYSKKIQNYEYQLLSNNEVILGYGYSLNTKDELKENNIENFLNNFRINYNGKINSHRKEVLKNNLIIKIEFMTEENQIINKEIVVKLTSIKNNKN